MSFPRYPIYKDSGVEWLGEVPEHWDVLRYKNALTNFQGFAFKSSDYVAESSTINIRMGNIKKGGLIDLGHNLKYLPDDYAETYSDYVLNEGDLIMAMTDMSPSLEFLAIPATIKGLKEDVTYLLNQRVGRLRIKYQFGHDYIKYSLLSHNLREQLKATGLGTVQANMSNGDLYCAFFSVPSEVEQSEIVDFLNRETAKIDGLVAEQRRLMELLKEKRQAVISHAVTKGLNPDAPMKSSGIEWLGDVPEHWEVKPLRHLGRCQNGINIGAEAFGSGFPFVSYSDVYKNRVLPPSLGGLVESSDLDRTRYSVQRGDVLFTRTSETIDEIGIASTCLSTIPDATFAGFLIRFRPGRALDCRFSKYYFSNTLIGSFFAREMNLITRASLSQGLLKQLPVLVPPESEQIEISAFLDGHTEIYDTLITEAQRAIDLLQERRTALISAAVTGQIDVRESVEGENVK